jgi:hypothetical protein
VREIVKQAARKLRRRRLPQGLGNMNRR